ncbi:MAG: hypothetical protein ACLU98_09095 [Desulfovibrio fairfieldensis]
MARTVTRPLREGFTTGTAATGAALAALTLLRTSRADSVDVPLRPSAPAAGKNLSPGAARAAVRSAGGGLRAGPGGGADSGFSRLRHRSPERPTPPSARTAATIRTPPRAR